jgi:dihydroorotate dehydrogenase (fumarate)
MDLSTTYLGINLPHPVMPGASPLADDLDNVRRLEDAGASAIVLRSLFAEQIAREQVAALIHLDSHGESFAEAISYFPRPETFVLGPQEYLEHLARVKAAVGVPVIASLNGTRPGHWLDYPLLIEQVGADALELNLYQIASDPSVSGVELEDRTVETVREVRRSTRLPLAVKLSPFYTSIPNLARRLREAGADGIVLFNRFYQPDIDPEELRVQTSLQLSRTSELLLRLRWIAMLSGRVDVSLAVTGGVHSGLGALKAVMAGAHAVQMVSALLVRGPEYVGTVRDELGRWLEEHEYDSLRQAQGSMNLASCPDPEVYERANYMTILQGWSVPRGLAV